MEMSYQLQAPIRLMLGEIPLYPLHRIFVTIGTVLGDLENR